MKFRDLTFFGRQILRLHLQRSWRVPLSVHIGLTNRCNNRCRYCRFDRLAQKDVWTTEALEKLLGEMKKAGTRRVQFTGGEPMLRDDIGRVLSRAKSLGMFVGLSTNGYRVAERAGELEPADIVQVSYDGPPEIHGYLRGEESVREAREAIEALLARGNKVWTTTVLTKVNAPYIEDVLNHARERGITANFVLLDFFDDPEGHFHPSLREIRDLVLGGEERREALRKLIELKRAGAPVGGSLPYFQNALDWPYDDRVTSSEPSPHYRCWAGRALAHLEADGKLYACGMGVGRTRGIDVLEDGFIPAWQRLRPLPDCNSCTMACGVESNLLFSLNPGTILNWLKEA